MRQAGLKWRAVTLTAREKVCARGGVPCDQLTCPLALGYYDRVKPAMREALDQEEITRAALAAGAMPAARQRVLEHFSWDVVMPQIDAVYARLLNRNGVYP